MNDYKKTLAMIRFYRKLKSKGIIKPNGTANTRLEQLKQKRKEGFNEEGIR